VLRGDVLVGKAVPLNRDQLRRELRGRRILVTGAAGSIGSALCRQLATFEPELLLLFDWEEKGLSFLDLELRRTYPSLMVIPILGNIQDRQKVEEVITAYAPEVIYHAAAYKYVPLMETHPLEAIENNVFGTETVAQAARRGGVKKFVLISTDKAVRPVGVMGMTKRVAECLLLSLDGGPTTFVAVRFGNVLGSDGSVLPLFRWQIAQGGPLTVTDPEATRYFMLLSEAAQLVLQAGAMGKGGEVFFLDMGEPVRILDLAENLVRLSGLEPDQDIPIQIVGLRPGERLREALVQEQEELLPTEHDKVLMVQNHRFDAEGFRRDLERLRCLVADRDRAGAVEHLKGMAGRY
jgi:FlaA1/EpsC-like NDP-sugar epimerase